MPIDKTKAFNVVCTAEDEQEKNRIRKVFKKHHVSMAGVAMDALRDKADKLEEKDEKGEETN
jgi:hypothetical protein